MARLWSQVKPSRHGTQSLSQEQTKETKLKPTHRWWIIAPIFLAGKSFIGWINCIAVSLQFAHYKVVVGGDTTCHLYYHCYTWVDGVKNIQLGSEIILVHYYCDRFRFQFHPCTVYLIGGIIIFHGDRHDNSCETVLNEVGEWVTKK